MFAEERDRCQFKWEDLGDVESGRPNLGQSVPVLVYLVGYKDVWEHSYVLLLVASTAWGLENTSPPLWLWALLIWEALPTPFALYDSVLPGRPFAHPSLDFPPA